VRTLRLRPWQHEALTLLERHHGRDFLAVATPGAGKTTFALTAIAQDLTRYPHRRVIVVAPTSHLKLQWAEAAAQLGIHLESSWSSSDPWPRDMHGVVVTYQQVAADPQPLRGPADDAIVVLDEVHHAGTERAWGDSVAHAFENAARRLSLSGTPFRSDINPIPFVTYTWEEAVADYTYGYGEALRDGRVVRPVLFPRVDGEMEWTAPDGAVLSATFQDELDRTRASQRLRTALSLDGQWLPEVLARADATLREIRQTHPTAGGLVIATDMEHAHGIAKLLRERFGRSVTVATSDDPQASSKIKAFGTDDSEWIVAVRMVSEGVDIPRLRVGVWATTTVTELFFRQAVGRLVRWTPGLRRQRAFFYLPDDMRLRGFAVGIAEARTHALRRRKEDEELLRDEGMLDELPSDRDEQMSLFEALSSTATSDHEPGLLDDDMDDDEELDDGLATGPEIMLAPPPPPLARLDADGTDADGAGDVAHGISRSQRKKELRQANSDRVQLICRLTGIEARRVNAQLNEVSRIQSINDATLHQLERRLSEADDWLARA
jgi:superfamily II DNA or RNA helicase